MPSPRWSSPSETPLAAAIAAATHEAWLSPQEGRSNRFIEVFRQLMGPERAEEYEFRALSLFHLQPDPPEGYDPPPAGAFFAICPRCTQLRTTKHTQPQRGRTKLQALRDSSWLQAQFDRGLSCAQVAKKLGCTASNVQRWADRHGIRTPRRATVEGLDAHVRAMHREGRGPGGIGRELGTTTQRIRESLKRQGLATRKTGHVYFEGDWWVERMRVDGWTKLQCAREAGIQPHAATYWINRFGLSDITKKNARRKHLKYPVLADPVSLSELLRRHDDVYESAAEELGCSPSLVSRYAREVLGRKKRHTNNPPHGKRSWWEARLERGMLAHEMAEEAGIEEKSAKEKLRLLGLLPQAYKNETARERQRRTG